MWNQRRYEALEKGSFFGEGDWFESSTYNRFITFAFLAAGVSFVLAFRNRNKKAETN